MTQSPNPSHVLHEVRVVRANPAQQAKRWRFHHHTWGDGFDLTLYLRRESALCESEYCRSSLAMWLLVGERDEVLASCESYASQAWVVDADGKLTREPMHTLASVVVEPALRNQGYATKLLDLVLKDLRVAGGSLTTLFSDVGPQLYRRSGHLLHPARESVVRVEAAAKWPSAVNEIGIGDVADLLGPEADRQAAWLGASSVPAFAEIATVERATWFHTRSQYRAWARGQTPHPVVGAACAAGGFCLWTSDAAESVLHILLWRPHSGDGARRLTRAAVAHAAEVGLEQVVWWDADRDTGLDPFHRAPLQPEGAEPRERQGGLPMVAWLDSSRPMPLVWMGIDRLGWR